MVGVWKIICIFAIEEIKSIQNVAGVSASDDDLQIFGGTDDG